VIALVVLVCPASPQSGKARTDTRRASAPRRAREQPSPRLGHTVRPGDTVWTIARRHGVSEEALIQANRLEAGQPLRVGQLLVIPRTAPSADSQEPPSLAEIVLGPPPATPAIMLAWPVSGPVGSLFGPRARGWHGGIDLLAERGTPIRAAAPGLAVMSGWERAYGRVVKLWHHEDLMTVYAHNHENYVKVGEWVERGQVIATVGATGRATAPHLHFEVRLGGKKYVPCFWLPSPENVDVADSAPSDVGRLR